MLATMGRAVAVVLLWAFAGLTLGAALELAVGVPSAAGALAGTFAACVLVARAFRRSDARAGL
jgi:hypothetical protein